MTLSLDIIYAARYLLAQGHAEVDRDYRDLSESDLSVLLSVHDQPGLTAKHLAMRLGRDKTTVSRSVSRLTRERLVRSEIDSLDGRRRALFLTSAGVGIAEQAANRIRAETERLTHRMTPEHLEMLKTFLTELVPAEQ